MEFTSEITVRLIQQVGGDHMVVAAARVSTSGEEADKFVDLPAEESAGLINYLVKCRHGSPFEHSSLTFFVHAPIFVWREWHRHRVGFCLAGDSEVYTETRLKTRERNIRKRPISELWRNWHEGVPDTMGRIRLLPSCRNLSLRVLNEKTGLFEIEKMGDITQSGMKEIIKFETDRGNVMRCSRDHLIFTKEGWRKAGDLQSGDRVAVCGKVPIPGDKICPPSLRRGIGVWTSMQRKRIIGEAAHCEGCGNKFLSDELVLDHKIPVVADLLKSLDINNLRPFCWSCHRRKTNSEQIFATGRGGISGAVYSPIKEKPFTDGEEMTYDISMTGEHRNFVANGIVVHNSYNEESGRYSELKPTFWIPRLDRKMIPVPGFKSARPQFVAAEAPLHEASVSAMKNSYEHAWQAYQFMLSSGVAKEVARCVLPVGIYSSCWVTTNPRALMHFLSLRTHEPTAKFVSYPQAEIEEAARVCEQMLSDGWALTYKAFVANGRVAP